MIFLLNNAERRWLDSTFGSRLTWFSHGGHLGNLYYLNVSGAVGDVLNH